MEDIIEKINYKGNEYIFVNDDLINGKKIYHFLNTELLDYLTNDESYNNFDGEKFPIFSLFCEKEKNRFIPIEEKNNVLILLAHFGMLPRFILPSIQDFFTVEEIGLIKTMLTINAAGIFAKFASSPNRTINIIMDEIKDAKILEKKEVTGNSRQKFIKEQKENLEIIKQLLESKIDLVRINKKLDNITINTCNIERLNKEYNRNAVAFYNLFTNGVYFDSKHIAKDDDNIENKRTRLHETIHYLAGKLYAYYCFANFIVEGGTENVVEELLGTNNSSLDVLNDSEEKIAGVLKFNFSSKCSYKPYVSLIKQLEYIMEIKSYDSAINGKMDFVKSVIKELGLYSFKLFAETNMMMGMDDIEKSKKTHEDNIEYLKKLETIEDTILEISFDRRFKHIKSIEDAQKYLEHLRGFEAYRPQIFYMVDDQLTQKNTFKTYYQNKYKELLERFKENSELLEKYEYKQQEFKSQISDKKIKEIYDSIIESLISEYDGDLDKIPRKIKTNLYKKGGSVYIEIELEELEEPIFMASLDTFDAVRLRKMKKDNLQLDEFEACKKCFSDNETEIEPVEIDISEEKLAEIVKKLEKPIEEATEENIRKAVIIDLLSRYYGEIEKIPQKIRINIHKKDGSYYIEGIENPIFVDKLSDMDFYRIRKIKGEKTQTKGSEIIKNFFTENEEQIETMEINLTNEELLQKYDDYKEEKLLKWREKLQDILESKIVYDSNGDSSKVPQKQEVKIIRYGENFTITEIDGEEIYNEFTATPELKELFEKILAKNPELSYGENLKRFLKKIGGEEEKIQVKFNEDELKEKREEYQEKQIQEDSYPVLDSKIELKPITFWEKIKNKIRKKFFKKKKDTIGTSQTSEEFWENLTDDKSKMIKKNENTPPSATRTSWDLENWGEGTKKEISRNHQEIISNISSKQQNADEVSQTNNGKTLD